MGIYVGAGGVKTVNSLYVGAGGVKTVTAVYVGAGGTYKVWPDGYSLEDNGYLDTYGYWHVSATASDSPNRTADQSTVDRQTCSATATRTTTNSDHWFSSNKPIDLTPWNYLAYGYYAYFQEAPASNAYNYLSGYVQLTRSPETDAGAGTHTTEGAYEAFTGTVYYGQYYIRSGWSTALTGADGYVFVICDISVCQQTNAYLGCGIMMGITSGSGSNRYHYLKLLDGYGPYLYTSYPGLSAPGGDSVSFSMTMTSTVNNMTIDAS